jgi:hypothetical protein
MGIALYKNNAAGSLAIALAPSGVSMTLGAGQGASFPTIVAGSGDYFYLTITSVATPTNFEIIKVTATTTDVLTISRAQDGTVAGGVGGITFAISDTVELRIVKAGLFSLLPHGKQVFTSSGTWLCPTNITTVYLSGVTGGGGGGGGARGEYFAIGGGGSGGGTGGFIYGTSPLTVVPGTSYTITLTGGTGGAGGVFGNSNGGAGTSASLSFGSLYTLAGGPGGAGGVSGGAPDGLAGASGYGIGTAGTSVGTGAGGAGGANQTAVYLGGSGGGGGGGNSGTSVFNGGNGGAGAAGFLIVEW